MGLILPALGLPTLLGGGSGARPSTPAPTPRSPGIDASSHTRAPIPARIQHAAHAPSRDDCDPDPAPSLSPCSFSASVASDPALVDAGPAHGLLVSHGPASPDLSPQTSRSSSSEPASVPALGPGPSFDPVLAHAPGPGPEPGPELALELKPKSAARGRRDASDALATATEHALALPAAPAPLPIAYVATTAVLTRFTTGSSTFVPPAAAVPSHTLAWPLTD